MSYYSRFGYSRSRPETVDASKVQVLLDDLSSVADNLTPWEKDFVASLKEGLEKYGSATVNQFSTLQKVASRNDPENILKRKAWLTSWSDEKRENIKVMAHYYLANPPYFGDLAKRILEDESYIPTEKAYRAMCENKYSQKVIATHNTDPLFPAGSMAVVRASQQSPHGLRGKTVLVIEHPAGVHNAANGAKRVKVLPIGEHAPYETEERWLKKLPKKLR